MKGEARVLAKSWLETHHVELLGYPDGSWGIRRYGRVLAIWEPSESDECLAALFEMIGTPQVIVLCSKTAALTCIAQGEAQLN